MHSMPDWALLGHLSTLHEWVKPALSCLEPHVERRHSAWSALIAFKSVAPTAWRSGNAWVTLGILLRVRLMLD